MVAEMYSSGLPCLLPSRNRSPLSCGLQTDRMRMPVMSRRDPYQPIKRTRNNVWFQSIRFQICYCSIKEIKKKKQNTQVFNKSLQGPTWSDLSHLIPLSLLTPFQPLSSLKTQVNSYLRAFAFNIPSKSMTSGVHKASQLTALPIQMSHHQRGSPHSLSKAAPPPPTSFRFLFVC